MRTFQIITLFVWLIQPIPIKATPVKGISDFDGSLRGVERLDFECPTNDEIKIIKPNEELGALKPTKSCWVDFYPTYLNVMDKQVIDKKDVLRFFQSPPSSGKCCASWNLIYLDNLGEIKMLSMRRNDLPFPLTKRKLKRLGTPANVINRWLAE
tara:strand:- start:2554 stop:3015 length:462 start_codon:yes stop_codon:yes gene_type:complete